MYKQSIITLNNCITKNVYTNNIYSILQQNKPVERNKFNIHYNLYSTNTNNKKKREESKNKYESHNNKNPFLSFFFFSVGMTAGSICANKLFEKFDDKRRALEMKEEPNELNSNEISKILRKNEESFNFNNCIVKGYETNNINSNNPIEDQHTQSIYKNKLIFGVYDGHSGPECGRILAKTLHNYVANSLSKLSKTTKMEKVIEAIKKSFINLDRDIINGAIEIDEGFSEELKDESLKEQMKSALSGSCALMALVDEDNLYVACTGDSRAVLGRKTKEGNYEAIPLSIDQTLKNELEVKRMEKEHPNEKDTMFIKNRVLGGLMPTRTFGDARYKWSSKIQKILVKPKFITRRPLPFYYTPPYITAEPEVTHHKISPEDSFVVLATDGIWDVLSNEDVVNLVSKNIENNSKLENKDIKKIPMELSTPSSLLIKKKKNIENENGKIDNNMVVSIRKVPAIFKDKNSATHIIRNSLGGSDEKCISKLLTIPSPTCRQHRDDMTVTIIYLNSDMPVINNENKENLEKAFVTANPVLSTSRKNKINDWMKYSLEKK